MRDLLAILALLSLGNSSPAAEVAFGKDLKPERAREILQEVRPGLLAVVNATPEGREVAVEAFISKADGTCEGWKRFRNPELKPLFVRLTESSDWHTRHRALLALEYLRDPATLPAAWKQLLHPERRVREKAAIACIKLWDKGSAPLLKPDFRKDVGEMAKTETDPHVKACYEALLRRIDGALTVERVFEGGTVKAGDGLVLNPYLDGMDRARDVAPGFVPKVVQQSGNPIGARSLPSSSWVVPVLAGDEKPIVNAGLPGFGDSMDQGRIHAGRDFAACLDGSGVYAAGDGVVRRVSAGTDAGTMLAIEHRIDGESLGSSVYMYLGDTIFVRCGERVVAGQLIATVGTSFSFENGGNVAHLHFGMYPGEVLIPHNHAFETVSTGLLDWLNPYTWLPRWRDGRPPGAEETAASQVERAGRLRQAGYLRRALGVLTASEKARRGSPGGEEVGAVAKAWREDAAFKKALAGEPGVTAAEEAASKPGKSGDPKVKKMWEALLAAFGDTELGPRIREGMDR